MPPYITHYFKLLLPPILFLAFCLTFFFLWKLLGLPPKEELSAMVEGWFNAYGLPVLFVSALIEGMLLVGNYYPGSLIIFLGVIVAGSVRQAIIVVSLVTAGFFIAHLFNYFLGKYGWYRLLVRFGLTGFLERAKERLIKRGPIAIFLSYSMPSFAALTDTAAGIIHMPFRLFFFVSLASVAFWSALWGAVVYSLGDKALALVAPSPSSFFVVVGLIVVGWTAILLIQDFRKRKEQGILVE